MKVSNLRKIFKDFYSNDDRAILVDGSWGIGKTHAILDFLEWTKEQSSGIPDNTVYKYVSLFGKESIDEIHTEIYKLFHPVRYGTKKALSLIPKVAALGNFLPGPVGTVANTISSLQYALKVTQNSPVKNEEIEHQVLFLDDLERVDFEKISFDSMLGYFDSLIRQGIKIIAICCSEMLIKRYSGLEEDFVSFKEKVFDREYKITATEQETILSYFDADSQIDENIIKEFNNNLRIAQRTSNFYKEIKNCLEKKKINSSETYSNNTLLESCTYVIVETHTSDYKKYTEDKSGNSVFNSHVFAMDQEDENIEENFKHIYYYIKDKYGYTRINPELIIVLLQYYFYRDEDKLSAFFNKNVSDSIFNKRVILLSDAGKSELFAEQIKHILDGKSLDDVNFIEVLNYWFNYSEFSKIKEKEDDIIESLIKNLEQYDQKINYLLETSSLTDNNDFSKFISKLNDRINDKSLNKMIENMRESWKKRDYDALSNYISHIEDEVYCFTASKQRRLNPDFEKFIKDSNYFIDDLVGEIGLAQWNLAQQMVRCSVRNGFDEELKQYINSLKKSDKSSEIRYQILLKKFY